MSKLDPKRRKLLQCLAALGAAGTLPLWAQQALAANPITVGFVYVGTKDDFGYNQAQAQAANLMKKIPGIKVVEEEKVPETVAVQKTMEAMINQDQAALIFATSYGYFDPHVIVVAKKYPKVRFAHCGGLWNKDKHPANAGSYFGYIAECQYLNGVAAAHATKSRKIGFIAAKPIPQVLQNINAFALGARSVNPAITTHVIFTGDWSLPVREAEATNSLADQGIDVVTCHVDGPKVIVETAEKRNIFSCGYHASQAELGPKGYLTGAEWDWSTPFNIIIKAALDNKPHPNFLRGGLKDGFVKMSPYGPGLSAAGKAKVDEIKAKMMKGEYVIFKGPLKDNKGGVVIAAGTAYEHTNIALESMNYLVEGVVGQMPG